MNNGLMSGLGASGAVEAGPVTFRRRVGEAVSSSIAGGRHHVDFGRGTIHHVTMYANTTVTMPEPRPGVGFTLMLQQDGTGSRTVTWPSTVAWGGGTAPTLTATANKTDVISFVGAPDGRRWFGFVGGLNF